MRNLPPDSILHCRVAGICSEISTGKYNEIYLFLHFPITIILHETNKFIFTLALCLEGTCTKNVES